MSGRWQGGGGGGRDRGGGRPGGRPRPRQFSTQADDPPGTSRLFIAVPVPDDVRDQVGRVMEEVAGGPVDERRPGGLRWVRVDGLHLTLRFLGATPDARISEVGASLHEAAGGLSPFRVALSGGGAFPNAHAPRVVWLAITAGVADLDRLARRIDAETQRLGWPPEDRPFKPHLTLARSDGVAGAADAVARLVDIARGLNAEWQADRVVLYRSLLGHGPARYEALAEAPLG